MRVIGKEEFKKLFLNNEMQEIQSDVIRKERQQQREKEKEILIGLRDFCLSLKQFKIDNGGNYEENRRCI